MRQAALKPCQGRSISINGKKRISRLKATTPSSTCWPKPPPQFKRSAAMQLAKGASGSRRACDSGAGCTRLHQSMPGACATATRDGEFWLRKAPRSDAQPSGRIPGRIASRIASRSRPGRAPSSCRKAKEPAPASRFPEVPARGRAAGRIGKGSLSAASCGNGWLCPLRPRLVSGGVHFPQRAGRPRVVRTAPSAATWPACQPGAFLKPSARRAGTLHDAPPLQPCLRSPSSIPALRPGSPFQRTGRRQPDFPRLHGRGRELACRAPRSPRQGQVHELPEGQLRQGPHFGRRTLGIPTADNASAPSRPGPRVDQQFASTGGSRIREHAVQEFAATCPLRLAGSFSRAFPVPQPLHWRQT